MEAATDAAVQVEGVVKRLGDHLAVDHLDLVVPRGVVFGFLGPNGAGKSTTLRMLNDIIAPDEGQIRLLGSLRPGREAAPHVGFLPEERGLYPKMKVLDMVAFLGELRGLTRREARARAGAWLERLGLASWLGHRVQDLSKGMQQKVQFAGTLIHEPELIFLDEPWSGLDPLNAEVLRTIVLEQRALGRTVVLSTHVMEQAEQICDAVAIIAHGRKVLDGTLADIRREATVVGRFEVVLRDEAARARALAGPFADASLVRAWRPLQEGFELDLVPGADEARLVSALVAADAAIHRFQAVVPTLHRIFVERVTRAEVHAEAA